MRKILTRFTIVPITLLAVAALAAGGLLAFLAWRDREAISFALANAGVEIPDLSYFNVFHIDPALGGVSMGIFLGLLVGKPLGISIASFLAVKFKAGEMPAGASWKTLVGVACLGGIGFTMSIFVDTLSFSDQSPEIMARLRDMGKVAVLMGSLCAGLLGSLLITIFDKVGKRP